MKSVTDKVDKHLENVYQRIKKDKRGCCPEWKDKKEGFECFRKWYHDQLAKQYCRCEYCYLPGDTEKYYGHRFRKGRRGLYLEVDRKNNGKEYSPENCVLSCYPCNNAKSDVFSYEEFKMIGEAISKVKLASKKENKKGGQSNEKS